MYFTVCQDQQNLIAVGVDKALCSPKRTSQDRREVGGTSQLHIRHCIHVAGHQMTETINLGIVGIVINREAMISLLFVDSRKVGLGTKSKSRDFLITVVVLDDIPDAFHHQLVLGRLLGDIMQGI